MLDFTAFAIFYEMKTSNIFLLTAFGALLLWLMYSAGGALAPFVLAAVFAYVLTPLARKMEAVASPMISSAILVGLIFGLLVLLPLALAPIIAKQAASLVSIMPSLLERVAEWVGGLPPEILEQVKSFDLTSAAEQAVQSDEAVNVAGAFFDIFGRGVSVVAEFLLILLVTPLTAFYLLRDRRAMAGYMAEAIPPRWREEILSVSRELDRVLGEFLHGQLLVMVVMSGLYAGMLSVAGLEFALTVGIISGILAFIPYVGFIIGTLVATLVALGQFDAWADFILVWAIMVVGTTVESVLITPWLVGKRVGLHPLAVLLSLFVMGAVFGFVGVLAALPLAAVLLSLFRHIYRRYVDGEFYGRSL